MKVYDVFKIMMAIMLTICLTGCAGNRKNTQEFESESSHSSEKLSLTVMMPGGLSNEEVVKIVQEMAVEFNTDNPYHAEIKVETYEDAQYKINLETMMAKNSIIDVFYTWEGGFLKPFVESGKVYEIGQKINQDLEWKKRFGRNKDCFKEVTFNGGIYAVPSTWSTAVVYYNTKIFEKQNLTVPKSYDEFLDICKTLSESDILPLALSGSDAWISGEFLQQVANGIGGMELYQETVDGTNFWDDERYIRSAKEFAKLLEGNYLPEDFLDLSQDEGRDLFINEKAAMYFMGSWDLALLTNETSPVSKNLGIFPLPPKNPKYEKVNVGSMDQHFAVGKNSRNIEASCAFVKMFSEPKYQKKFAYLTKNIVSTDVDLDEKKLHPLLLEIEKLKKNAEGFTPWFDRKLGALEGTEFNNVAQSILSGKDPEKQMMELEQYSKECSISNY